MAGLDDFFKADTAKTVGIGIGAALLIPVVLPMLATVGRPVAKAAIKSGLILFEKGRETLAEVGEVFEDLVAEAKAEIHPEPFTVGAAQVASEAVAETETPPSE